MAQNEALKNDSPVSMDEARAILDMAIQTSKKLKEFLKTFNTQKHGRNVLKDRPKER